MSSSKATQIKEAIIKKYQLNGTYYSPKLDDISKHLKLDDIDNNASAPHDHKDYTESDDGSLIIFLYDDNSVLLVSSEGIDAPF
jgi:hypothetical protein